MRLSDKRVLITGAASGIGLSGCHLFARHGARVVAVDRDGAALERMRAAAPDGGERMELLVADLGDASACHSVVQQAAARLGGLDVFWGNAGVVGPGGIEDLDPADYVATANINLQANVLMASAVIGVMKARGGSMIFTSSISGLVGSRKSPVYAVTKHGLIGLVRSLAIAHGPQGIRVNAICPGLTETPMLPNAMGRNMDVAAMERNKAEHVASIPLGRVASALEIAQAALWLASDESSYVTGIALPVDGGFTCA